MAKTLIDYSMLAIAACAANAEELNGDSNPHNLAKHIILTSLLNTKEKCGGEIIVCVDSKTYWRKDIFPSYKGHRVHTKEADSFLDWKLIHEVMDEVKKDLIENFTYKVLEVDGAEADDIIACMCKYFDENELVNTGLIDEPQPVIIVSSDGDFLQLQKYKHVTQWSNRDKKFLVCDSPSQAVMEHICTGDVGDNFPNICTGDWWSVGRANNEKVRQKPFKKTRLNEFCNRGMDACLDNEERDNFLRNQRLADFDFIPEHVYNRIIDNYILCKPVGNKTTIMNYLVKNRMKLLLADIGSF